MKNSNMHVCVCNLAVLAIYSFYPLNLLTKMHFNTYLSSEDLDNLMLKFEIFLANIYV